METQPLGLHPASVSDDNLSVTLRCEGLREGFVHEFHLTGVRSSEGRPLLHSQACYTLNRKP